MSKLPNDPGYRGGWCIHYRGIFNGRGGVVTSCEAGVEYETFRGQGFDRQPCFLDNGNSRPGAAPCAHLRRPTTEEIASHEEWAKARMAMMVTAMTGIADWRKKHKGRSHAEIVECPACKGRLHLSIAAYNGHVHGRCETEACVEWME